MTYLIFIFIFNFLRKMEDRQNNGFGVTIRQIHTHIDHHKQKRTQNCPLTDSNRTSKGTYPALLFPSASFSSFTIARTSKDNTSTSSSLCCRSSMRWHPRMTSSKWPVSMLTIITFSHNWKPMTD